MEEKIPSSEPADSFVREFCNYTTIHGFSRLAAARGVSWRVFWIFMLIGAHCAFYYHTYLLVKDYLEKPVRTKVTMRHGKKLVFPTITICNQNVVRKSKAPLDLINMIASITRETNRTKRSKNITCKSSSQSGLPGLKLKHDGHVERESLQQLYNKYKTDELKNYGHQLENMILDCSFDGEDCTPSSNDEAFAWRHIWLEQVGNCYMFNRALDDLGKKTEAYKSTMAGKLNGLNLLLNVEQYEYLDDISPYAGLGVVIATQGHMPFPQTHGINLAPGFDTSIQLRMNHISRLDPFRNRSCEMTGKLQTDNVFWLYNMTYSKMACKISCLISMQRKKCHCAQYHLPTVNNISFCDYKNASVMKCLSDVAGIFQEGICNPVCPSPCSDIYFTTSLSSSKWPSNSYKKRLNEKLKNDFQMSMTENQIRNNLIELHVYYADLDYVHVEETLKYEFQDVISNVGGQLGMWIGISALSIAEVIELFIIVFNFLINKRKQHSAVNVQRIDVR